MGISGAAPKRGPHRAADVMEALECPVERQLRSKIVGATQNEFYGQKKRGRLQPMGFP